MPANSLPDLVFRVPNYSELVNPRGCGTLRWFGGRVIRSLLFFVLKPSNYNIGGILGWFMLKPLNSNIGRTFVIALT